MFSGSRVIVSAMHTVLSFGSQLEMIHFSWVESWVDSESLSNCSLFVWTGEKVTRINCNSISLCTYCCHLTPYYPTQVRLSWPGITELISVTVCRPDETRPRGIFSLRDQTVSSLNNKSTNCLYVHSAWHQSDILLSYQTCFYFTKKSVIYDMVIMFSTVLRFVSAMMSVITRLAVNE